MRRLKDNERGDALVLVISSIFLIGMMLVGLSAITVNAAQKSAGNRANAQAIAAADGGLDYVIPKLLAKQPCVVGETQTFEYASGQSFSFTVEKIEYKSNEGPTQTCVTGNALPNDTSWLSVTTVGSAVPYGNAVQVSQEEANTARVERTLSKAKLLEMEAAIHSGGPLDQANGADSTNIGEGEASDVISEGKWTCHNSDVYAGSVYAYNGVQALTGGSGCEVKGDLFIQGDFVSNHVTVGGTLFVNGNLKVTNGLKAHGKIFVTGNIDISSDASIAAAEVMVKGNFTDTNGVVLKADVIIGGDYNPAYADTTYGGNVYVKGKANFQNPAPFSKLAAGKRVYGVALPPKTSDSWWSGQFASNSNGKFEINQVLVNSKLSSIDWTIPAQIDPNTRAQYPFLNEKSAEFQHLVRMSKTEFMALSGMNNACQIRGSQAKRIVFTAPTLVDLTGCDLRVAEAPVEIVLTGDSAIVAENIHFDSSVGTLKVISSTDVSSTRRPTLFLAARAQDDQTQCTQTPSGKGNLFFGIVGLSQKGSVSNPTSTLPSSNIVFYGTGVTRLEVKPGEIYGQVYGCKVETAAGRKLLIFSPQTGSSESRLDLKTLSIRDITD